MRLRRVGASAEHRPRRHWSCSSTWVSVRPLRRTSSPATTQRRTSCIAAPGFLLAIMLRNMCKQLDGVGLFVSRREGRSAIKSLWGAFYTLQHLACYYAVTIEKRSL